MNEVERTGNILISAAFAKALVKFRAELKNASKDAKNPFFGSTYADLASIIEAAREPLTKNGLAYQQIVHNGDAASVETLLIHESGEFLSCGVISIMPSKRDPQGFGSAITYARRYSLQAALGIAAEDDDGNEATKPTTKTPAPQPIVEKELDDPAKYCWYDFKGVLLNKAAVDALKRHDCHMDDANGLWYSPKQLPGNREGYRTTNPYEEPPVDDDDVPWTGEPEPTGESIEAATDKLAEIKAKIKKGK